MIRYSSASINKGIEPCSLKELEKTIKEFIIGRCYFCNMPKPFEMTEVWVFKGNIKDRVSVCKKCTTLIDIEMSRLGIEIEDA